MAVVTVVGGGLAGCEAAWQLAQRGHPVHLIEMRPLRSTPAHQTADLAELVCTNSFKSTELRNAHGLLKAEMRDLGSLLLEAALRSRVPAGAALAVDRTVFAAAMTAAVVGHPAITIERREVEDIPAAPAVVATGPLTSAVLSAAIARLLGDDGLAFYDSIAPIVSFDSIDGGPTFLASRYGKGDGSDYLNCPLDANQYAAFVEALRSAAIYPGHDWEQIPPFSEGVPPAATVRDGSAIIPDASPRHPGEAAPPVAGSIPFFEGCLPVEVMAARGLDVLRFGPMKPVGLRDPHTGRRPYAVVQLRREDRDGQMWNLVGFQTRLRTGEQRRVFRMIPGLEQAEFLRYGSMHRNTYLNFPARLSPYGACAERPGVIFAGQLTGVEGYTESAASGILAGINLDRLVRGLAPVLPPPTTMLGGLYHYLRDASSGEFQPMNSNFGLLAPLDEPVRQKAVRRQRLVDRARSDFRTWVDREGIGLPAATGVEQ